MKAIKFIRLLVSILKNQIKKIEKFLQFQSNSKLLELILIIKQDKEKCKLVESVKMILNISSYILKIISIYNFFNH